MMSGCLQFGLRIGHMESWKKYNGRNTRRVNSSQRKWFHRVRNINGEEMANNKNQGQIFRIKYSNYSNKFYLPQAYIVPQFLEFFISKLSRSINLSKKQ